MPMLWPLRSLRTKREGVGEHERKEDDAGAELVAATAGDDEEGDLWALCDAFAKDDGVLSHRLCWQRSTLPFKL